MHHYSDNSIPACGAALTVWWVELCLVGYIYIYAKCYFWAHMTTFFIPCSIMGRERHYCLLQAQRHTQNTLLCPSFFPLAPHPALPHPTIYLFLYFTFAASITFEESQIFHGHACGRFPSTWEDSINLSWFAFLKLDKGNALCSTSNAFCIIPVFDYIFENLQLDWIPFPGFRLPNRSVRLFIYRFKLSWRW